MAEINKEIGKAGVIDDEIQYDFKRTQMVQSPEPEQPKVREVTIRVPSNISDNMVNNAWQVGMGTVQRVGMGMVVIAFSSVDKTPDGKPFHKIGKFEMVVAKAEDVKRLLELADHINKLNLSTAEAAKDPSRLLDVTINGTRSKDEKLRDLKARAEGREPIVAVRSAGPAGGIQIATR